MKMYTLLFALLLSALPVLAQSNKQIEASNIPTITFCDLINNPDIFDGREVRFRATYLSNSKVATFIDQNCMEKDKRTWAEFDGISIKASSAPEIFEKVEKQIFCGKCGDDNSWREIEMLVTATFDGSDIGHGRLGKFRFAVMVKQVEEMSDAVKVERTKYDLRQ